MMPHLITEKTFLASVYKSQHKENILLVFYFNDGFLSSHSELQC